MRGGGVIHWGQWGTGAYLGCGRCGVVVGGEVVAGKDVIDQFGSATVDPRISRALGMSGARVEQWGAVTLIRLVDSRVSILSRACR